MKASNQIGQLPAAVPLRADDVLEFHAARLLLLFSLCGTGGRIESLTKMAKLDFFVRYPDFFAEVCRQLGVKIASRQSTTESAMVRHHYGPWDQRYYHVLGYLEGRGLLEARQSSKAFVLKLTPDGKKAAAALRKKKAFADICAHMKQVKKALGRKSGSAIKKLIYQTFQDEVAVRALGESIEAKR